VRKHVAVFAIGVRHLDLAMAPAVVGLGLVLMGMVAEVKRGTLFMLAVDGSSRPAVLGWQEQHQQNEQIFFHKAHDSTIARLRESRSTAQGTPRQAHVPRCHGHEDQRDDNAGSRRPEHERALPVALAAQLGVVGPGRSRRIAAPVPAVQVPVAAADDEDIKR
jgi:hypothetical protein